MHKGTLTLICKPMDKVIINALKHDLVHNSNIPFICELVHKGMIPLLCELVNKGKIPLICELVHKGKI